MENIFKIIENINNITNAVNMLFEGNEIQNIPYEDENIASCLNNINNICEYVDNYKYDNINNQSIYNNSMLSENNEKTEEFYKYMNNLYSNNINNDNFYSQNIHSLNTSNKADYSNFAPNFVDNSEKLVDNNYNQAKNNEVFHNDYGFKEIYNFMESTKYENNEKPVTQAPNININLGGVTQNITESNGNKVLEELSDMLVKALSGCDGVY